MLRFVTVTICNRSHSVEIISNVEKRNRLPQLYSFAQKKWQSTQPKRSFIASFEKGKNITAFGWFLLAIPATAFGLGCWQIKRKSWKEQLIKDLELQTKMAKVPLPHNLKEIPDMEYRLVNVRGKFLHDKEILMGPRSFVSPDGSSSEGGMFSLRDGGNGYLVITPFKLSDRDEVILVNRGWVSRKQIKPEMRAEGQLNQEVELNGVVRMGESRPQFSPDHKGGIFLYRDLPQMCAMTGASPVFLDATYDSTIPGGPIGGQTRVTLRNEHLSYIITWFSLSIATSYLWYRQMVKGIPF